MPTPRKSLAELARSGTLANTPGRYTKRLAAVPVITHSPGRAPAHFSPEQKAVWAELLRLAPIGLLMKSDRIALEILTNLVFKVRSTSARTGDYNALLGLLARFGMTPDDRLRMVIERAPEPEEIKEQAESDKFWDQFDS